MHFTFDLICRLLLDCLGLPSEHCVCQVGSLAYGVLGCMIVCLRYDFGICVMSWVSLVAFGHGVLWLWLFWVLLVFEALGQEFRFYM